MNEQTLCFTGHRAINGIKGGSSEVAQALQAFLLNEVIKPAYEKKNVRNFFSGGAIGVDQIAAKAVIQLKAEYPDAKLIIARPFPSQDTVWPMNVRSEYYAILSWADSVIDVAKGEYTAAKMQGRNIFMVNKAMYVVAVWNGVKKGGTWNCVDYAFNQGKKVCIINPADLTTKKWYQKQITQISTGGQTNEQKAKSTAA